MGHLFGNASKFSAPQNRLIMEEVWQNQKLNINMVQKLDRVGPVDNGPSTK